MRPETFLEKFDLIADAPGAVAKMRELVLDWAVTGRLCHKNTDDWKEGNLGDVIDLISGQHLLAHEHNSEKRGIPYLTGPSDFGAINPIPTRWTDQPKVIAKPGDILITVKGSGVGKTNVLLDQTMAISRQLMAIRVKGADPDFVHIALKRAAEHFQNSKTGIAIPGIGRKEVLGLRVVLPPLAEQKRIVAKVDELMALCDRLEQQQNEREAQHAALSRASLTRFSEAPTPENLEYLFHPSYTTTPADLRKTILTLAVQGHLSTHAPGSAERKTVQMKEVCALITDGEHATPQRVPSGVPLATAKNVRDGFLDMALTDYVAPETAEKCWKRCKPKHGDILMVCVGATTGRVCLVSNPPDMVLVRSVALLRPNPNYIEGKFLDLFLRSPSGQSQVWGGVRQNAQPCLYLGKMSEFMLPLPPLAEQKRIVAKVDELMKLVDQLEAQLTTARTTAENLLNSLLADLTSQKAA